MKWHKTARRDAFSEPFITSIDKEVFCSRLNAVDFFKFTRYLVVDMTRYLDSREFDSFERSIRKRVGNEAFVRSAINRMYDAYEALEKVLLEVSVQKLRAMSNEELAELLRKYLMMLARAHETFWVATSISNCFAEQVREALLHRLKQLTKEEDFEKYFSIITNPYEYLKVGKSTRARYEKEFKEVVDEIDFLKEDISKIKKIREIIFLRTFRREKEDVSTRKLELITKEIGRRTGLGKKIYLMTYSEILKLMKKGKRVPERKLSERKKEIALLFEKNVEKVLTGPEIRMLGKQVEEIQTEEMNELQGMVACRGFAEGKVRVVKQGKVGGIREGEILVTMMTTPDFAPAIRKCAGIITEEGGITCHAAILSREFNVPCVVGIKKATKILKNGDHVVLDAEKGRVIRKGK